MYAVGSLNAQIRTMSLIRRWLIMTVLAFSGGIIFLLPFLREVYYKPMMDALALTNTELSVLMSVFGFVSMLAYFPGGWLADRVSPRYLISGSLLATGAGGLWFATFPSYEISVAIHGFWGLSITLLFWGAMIRVTRNWAPPDQQGRAFGILEMLRGIGEILPHVALLAVFAWLGSSDQALSVVILQLSLVIIFLGVVSWFVIEDVHRADVQEKHEPIGIRDVLAVLKLPVIWLISVVVMAAYCAYWGSFYFTPYATDVFLTTAAVAGVISIGRQVTKLFAAPIAGFIADRFGIAATVAVLFLMLVASFTGFAFLPGDPAFFQLMLVNVAVAGIAIFALRGIYFALLEEGGVPLAVTGTAGGIVSAVGFTPDVFMPLLGGVLLDAYPGVEGYRYFYLSVAGICVVGFTAALIIARRYVRSTSDAPAT